MCERLSVFLLIDKQWRLNLVKKRKNKHQRHTHASLLHVLPFFVLPHFDITYDVPLSEKTHSKICYKFPFYHLSVEPEDEHGLLMLLLNNCNVKVSGRGHQERHKHKTKINRLLKQ